jgi:hypothetical protein
VSGCTISYPLASLGVCLVTSEPTWTEMTESCGALASPVTSRTEAGPSAKCSRPEVR